jgi:mannose-6-phosphate isomerase-like protein (cupin superfamily)
VKTNPLRPGHVSTDIWKTNAAPAPITGAEADPTLGPAHAPSGAAGNRHPHFRARAGIGGDPQPGSDHAREVFAAMGNAGASTFGRGGRHPMMHRTETIDYAIVLEGEITLLLDDEDVQLKAGDVVIQRGTNHAWSNRSNKPARMLYILIDGRFDPALQALFTAG